MIPESAESAESAEAGPLRLFIALELPETILHGLGDLQSHLRQADTARAMRWSALGGIHLTLKFLGDTPPDRVGIIGQALERATRGHKPFTLHAERVGCFPDLRRPRVVWAGVAGDRDALFALRDAVEAAIAPLGFPTEDRPFSPHLTLGRAREHVTAAQFRPLKTAIEAAVTWKLPPWQAAAVHLFRSELRPSGAVYTCLVSVSLNAG